MFAMKSKDLFREVKLSVPFRSVCYHCRRSLDLTDRKYTNPNIKFGYYCEECKGDLWKHNA
jgi:predicted SprT family Zn-dependent metalloprotease